MPANFRGEQCESRMVPSGSAKGKQASGEKGKIVPAPPGADLNLGFCLLVIARGG